MVVGLLADPAKLRLSPGRVLARHEPDPSGKLAPSAKMSPVAHPAIDGMDGPCTHRGCAMYRADTRHQRELSMQVKVVRLDLAKQVFQVRTADICRSTGSKASTAPCSDARGARCSFPELTGRSQNLIEK